MKKSLAPMLISLIFLLFAGSSSIYAAVPLPFAETGSTQVFSYPDFSDVSGLNLIVDAAQVDNRLRITPAKPDQVGAVWYASPVLVRDSFVTSFDFQITEPGVGNDPDGNPGADGFAFVIQNYGALTIGGGGGSIGFSGIPNSLAIEFDTWNNGPNDNNGDPNGNHISVHTRGVDPNNSDHSFSLGVATAIPNLSDAAVHRATIRYQFSVLEIYVDNTSVPVLSVSVDLSDKLSLGDGQAWVGFTSATGNYENHDILSWSFQGKTPPQAQNVAIGPATPTDNDDLSLSYSYYDADNDAENKGLRQIRWYRNGNLQSAFNEQTVVSRNFTYLGEEWCATIRPHDGAVYGSITTSNCVIVRPDGNQLPVALNVLISPANPTSNDNLALSYSYSDPDLDPEAITQIFWYRDGMLQPAFNNVTVVPAPITLPGELWWATVRPHDGQDYGVQVSTTPVEIVAPVVNTPPQTADVQITPAQPGARDHLQISYTFLDVDGDPEGNTRIFWYRNLTLQEQYNGRHLVPSHATAAGDHWYAQVYPHDGHDFGQPVSAQSVLVLREPNNTRPELLSVSLTPDQPSATENLGLFYIYHDADDDPEGATMVRWSRDGTAQSAFNDQTSVPASATSIGQTWCVTITPHDGIDPGEPVTPDCVTIVAASGRINAEPAARDVYIDPSLPATVKPLRLRYDYFDPDGDREVDSQIRWYKDNVHQIEFDDITVVPSIATGSGQNWHATIEPHDGTGYGAIVSAPAVRINHPPQLGSATVAKAGLGLRVSYSDYQDADNDPEGFTSIDWNGNGIPRPSLADLEWISACGMMNGERWYATVAPHDGIESGQPVASNVVTMVATTLCRYFPNTVHDPQVEYLCSDLQFNEDNDRRAQACKLFSGVTYSSYPDDADDIYYFILEQTSSVDVRVTNYTASAAGHLQIFNTDAFNNVVYLAQKGGLQGTGELPDSSAPHALENLPPGKYYVRVYTWPGHFNSTHLYQLVINITPR